MNESSRDIDIRRFQNLLSTSIDQRECGTIQRILTEERNKTAVQTSQRKIHFPIPHSPLLFPKDETVKSAIAKHSIVINGHKTSVSLEDAFWFGLKGIAEGQRVPVSEMIGRIDKQRVVGNLSSALRLFVYGDACAQMAAASADRVGQSATIKAAA